MLISQAIITQQAYFPGRWRAAEPFFLLAAPEPKYDAEAARRLAIAIFCQAALDVKHDNGASADALAWLKNNGADWLDLCGTDPESPQVKKWLSDPAESLKNCKGGGRKWRKMANQD